MEKGIIVSTGNMHDQLLYSRYHTRVGDNSRDQLAANTMYDKYTYELHLFFAH